ncbi:hypothetical protein ACT8ZS_31265 [Paenibacillus sp. M.A.Huq-84]
MYKFPYLLSNYSCRFPDPPTGLRKALSARRPEAAMASAELSRGSRRNPSRRPGRRWAQGTLLSQSSRAIYRSNGSNTQQTLLQKISNKKHPIEDRVPSS